MSIKQGSLIGSDSQSQDQDLLNVQHELPDVRDETHTQVEDKFLLTAIESASQVRALEFLKRDHPFSHDTLNRALLSASQQGHKFIIQKLVCLGADVQCKDTDGNTPLLICAKNGFTDLVDFFLTSKADVNAVNSVGDTALILSLRSSGSGEMLKVLLEQPGINLNHQNQHGYTALMKAVEVMDTDAMKMLLEKVYNHNLREPSYGPGRNHRFQHNLRDQSVDCEKQPAQELAEKSGLGNIFRILKEHTDTGRSLLMLAIKTGDIDSFNILIDYQLSETDNVERDIEEAFRSMFDKCHMKNNKNVNNSDVAMIRRLLEYGADVNMRVNRCFYEVVTSPLHIAAKIGHQGLLELLLSYKAEVNQANFTGSALDCALSHGHIDCARLLIQHGAKLHIEPALFSAVNQQMEDCVTFICENYQQETQSYLNRRTDSLSRLLTSAVRGGNLKIIGQILDAGADINRPSDTGVIPLVSCKNGEVAKLLIKRGADVTQMINNDVYESITPVVQLLMTRSSYDPSLTELVQVLLENGASASGKSRDGRTALMLATSKEGSVDLLQILLDHGADLSDKDKKGNTALIHAVLQNYCPNVSFLLQFTTSKNFLNAQNCNGSTALMCAAKSASHNILTKLINCGADMNIRDMEGNTALSCALMELHGPKSESLTALISAGSDVNCQNNDGLSPLMLAASRFLNEAVEILLDSGADVNAVNKNNPTRTALSDLLTNIDKTYLLNSSSVKVESKFCVQSLLARGASSSYVSPAVLHNIICCDWMELIPQLIQSGLGPADVKPSDILWTNQSIYMASTMSPLYLALLTGNVELLRYFIGNLFLTKSDVSLLMSNENLRDILEWDGHTECLQFLDDILSQPLPLFKLAFVAVSSAVGTSPGRENRVNLLPLPQMMKDKLLFKLEEVTLTCRPTALDTVDDNLDNLDTDSNYNYGRYFPDYDYCGFDDYDYYDSPDI